MSDTALPVVLRVIRVVNFQREFWRSEKGRLNAARRYVEITRCIQRLLTAQLGVFRHSWVHLGNMLKVFLGWPRVFKRIILDLLIFFLLMREKYEECYYHYTIKTMESFYSHWTLSLSFWITQIPHRPHAYSPLKDSSLSHQSDYKSTI